VSPLPIFIGVYKSKDKTHVPLKQYKHTKVVLAGKRKEMQLNLSCGAKTFALQCELRVAWSRSGRYCCLLEEIKLPVGGDNYLEADCNSVANSLCSSECGVFVIICSWCDGVTAFAP